MKRIFITVVTLLLLKGVAVAQQSTSDETLEFRPHWGLRLQGGTAYTVGAADFADLISPSAQLSATYNFHHAMGVRFGLDGWQGKGTIDVLDEIYRFRFLQLHADYVVDLASLFGGFKHNRIWTPYIFAGIAGAYGFDNQEAAQYTAQYGQVVSNYWETAPFFALRAGAGVDFWLTKNVSLGMEVNANGYSDKLNSKPSLPTANPDINISALLGLKVRFGGNTRPSAVYAANLAAAERAAAEAEAARLAAEKEAAEKAAAEKAEAERLAAEKAAAEKAEAARLAAEKAAAERAALAAANSDNIFFTIGSSNIRKSEDAKLVKLAEFMKANPDFTVAVVGYADKATGNAAVNLRISEKRAKNVMKRLVALGIAAERITVDHKGDTVQPFEQNDKNRVIICTLR